MRTGTNPSAIRARLQLCDENASRGGMLREALLFADDE